jgi:transcriptional regulator with XRE-family HTH domain
MNQFYKPDEFAALVKSAVGNTKKKEFASLIDVTPEYLSRILNSKLANPPSIQKIQLIANHASNAVTYAQLLNAAGYVSDETSGASFDAPSVLTDTEMKFMQGTLLTALSSLGIPFTLEQSKKDTDFQLSVSLHDGAISQWHFFFLHNNSPELMSSCLNALYCRLIFEPFSETEKISFVTTSATEYSLYLEKLPANLNLNLSVMLIEKNTLSISREHWLHSVSILSDEDISFYTL